MYLGDCLSPRCSAGWKTALGAQAIVLQHPSTVQAAKHSTLCPAWQPPPQACPLTRLVGVGAAARSRGCGSGGCEQMMRSARYQLPGSRDAATWAERLGDSTRLDVFEDAPPSPAPLALSAVLKAQTGKLPGPGREDPICLGNLALC